MGLAIVHRPRRYRQEGDNSGGICAIGCENRLVVDVGLGTAIRDFGGTMSSLFERSGGFAAVSKVVMAFYDKVLDSDIAGPYFENVDMKALIDHQTKFVAQVMGGPAEYNNEVLKAVHAKHKIDQEAFDEVALLMKETLEDFEFDSSDIAAIMHEIKSRSSFIISA